MNDSHILYEKKDHVAWLRLNMPEKMNPLEESLFQELYRATSAAAEDDDVRCFVLTGSGRAFCAGGDISRFKEGFTLEEGCEYVRHFAPFVKTLVGMKKPTIAAVNGYAVGAGFCLAMMCDVIYATQRAKFGMAFRNMGLVPDVGGMYFLPRLVGLSKAKELTFTGRIIDANEAERLGIVSQVFADDCFQDKVNELAGTIAAGPAFALSESKNILNQSLGMSFDELLLAESYAQGLCFQTAESAEGVEAFLGKRSPNFLG